MHSVFVIYIQSDTVALISIVLICHGITYHYKINIVYICVVRDSYYILYVYIYIHIYVY